MPADVEVLLDHNDGCAVLERRHRSGEPRGAGPDRDEVRGHVPPLAAPLGFDLLNAEPQQSARAGTSGTFAEEVPPTDISFVLLAGMLASSLSRLNRCLNRDWQWTQSGAR